MSQAISAKIAEYRTKLNVDYDDFELDLIRKDFESSKYYDSLLELE